MGCVIVKPVSASAVVAEEKHQRELVKAEFDEEFDLDESLLTCELCGKILLFK